MDILEAIHTRTSCRAFLPDPVSESDLQTILGAATRAPSAGNLQPWRFVVVRNSEQKARLAGAAFDQGFLQQAPVVLAVCIDLAAYAERYPARGPAVYSLQDAAAATQNILLAAHALGYGACWVGAFDEDQAALVLNVPRNVRPSVLIPLGRPVEPHSPHARRPLDAFIYNEQF